MAPSSLSICVAAASLRRRRRRSLTVSDEHPVDGAVEEDVSTEHFSRAEVERIADALVFASAEPVSEAFLADRLPQGTAVPAGLGWLAEVNAARGLDRTEARRVGKEVFRPC